MNVTEKTINIFVIGDLVLDHAIFVRTKVKPYQLVEGEQVFEVERRIDIAGGAANCARILASLSRGRTYLWGVTGRSPWGSFGEVLADSHIFDAAASIVQFRAIHDESIKMNTITRVISVSGDRRQHISRFDDVGHVSMTEAGIKTLTNHLHNAHEEVGLHAIIINDLDMNTLNASLVKSIADFASTHQLPLFIDPKRKFEKYEGVSATAILPNLKEWCTLIGEGDRDQQWRTAIGQPEGLAKIARRSLQQLPNFDFHIIKCDSKGAILIAPATEQKHMYSVYHIPPHPTQAQGDLPHQLGCGDILTSIIALEFVSADRTLHPSKRMRHAFEVANGVVARYREMPWQRMPTRAQVIALNTPSPKSAASLDISAAARYMPKTSEVKLSNAETAIPGLLSVDEAFRDFLDDIVSFFKGGWDNGNLISAVLTGRGGTGKTEICNALPRILEDRGIRVFSFDNEVRGYRNSSDVETEIENRLKKLPNDYKGMLITIDEAFARAMHLLEGKLGVLFLEAGDSHRTRFLFIDADFDKLKTRLSGSQFLSRCRLFTVPSIAERPNDIIFVFFGGMRKSARNKELLELDVESDAVLAVIDWFLNTKDEEQSARKLYIAGRETFDNTAREANGRGALTVRVQHLPDDIRNTGSQTNGGSIIKLML